MPLERYMRTLGLGRVPSIHPAILCDDASGAFNYIIEGTGDTFAASYEPEAALVGQRGILLQTRTINQANNDYVQITKHIHLPPTKLLRLQLAFAHPAAIPSATFIIYLHWYTGTTRHFAGLTFTKLTADIDYWGEPAGWHLLLDDAYIINPLSWNKVDLSLNINLTRYSHLLINEYAQDMSNLAIPTLPDAGAKRVDLVFLLTTKAAQTAYLHIDQILVTPETL